MVDSFTIVGHRILLNPTLVINWFLASTIVVACGISGLQADGVATSANQKGESRQLTILEGKTFSGNLGPLGKPASATDLLVFSDGMFVSKGCEARCGYTAAKYQINPDGDFYQVRSETPCLKSDAVIQWRGTVKGDQIEGTFTWVNKRWYWTFEKEFWFKGELVNPDSAETGQ